jgi:hypothetical protein
MYQKTPPHAHRCMYFLTDIATRERDNLATLMTTGVYPGSRDPEFNDIVERLLGPDENEAIEAQPGSDGSVTGC